MRFTQLFSSLIFALATLAACGIDTTVISKNAGVGGTPADSQDTQTNDGNPSENPSPAVGLLAASNGSVQNDILFSPSGDFVAFTSNATNLGASGLQIYLKSRKTNTVKIVSADAKGAGLTGENPKTDSISADGRYVVFESYQKNQAAGGVLSLYLKDMNTGSLQKIPYPPANANPSAAQGFYAPATVTADGKYIYATVIYVKHVGGTHVFRYPINALNAPIQIDTNPSNFVAQGFAYAEFPKASADGRYVFFADMAVYPQGNGAFEANNQVFMKDMQTGAVKMITNNGQAPNANGAGVWWQLLDLSPDSQYILCQDENTQSRVTDPQLARFNTQTRERTDVFSSQELALLKDKTNWPADAHLANKGDAVVFTSRAALVPGLSAGLHAYLKDLKKNRLIALGTDDDNPLAQNQSSVSYLTSKVPPPSASIRLSPVDFFGVINGSGNQLFAKTWSP